ncbi:putative serine protease K12H4.7 [Harpegnathos saltator]|uniref:Putative serine protease K12H4.7 n=1 Tax=Harpegnathos saltator TaxID=610380 RepID=E2BVA8_HARSA|nr:putative serine protease K12H4.7 [Harpegnathos saltator]EFN80400.1 Putative serine protease K12H4.7 [Harpegnathos saltator]
MTVLNVLLVLCSIQSFANGMGFRGFTYRGLEEPKPIGPYKDQVIEGWITQPLDHFNPRENRTWSMRYYENSALLRANGPILITIGGEWTISTGFLQGGLMYEIASVHGGMMYYTEHRFYGKSRPTKDTSASNLRYLSVDQALADLANFIETKKKEKNLENSPVIVFGGSYAGNMATWARLKYPHLIQGALASSAPIYAKADFYEYYEVVTRSLGRHSAQCVADVKTAFESVEELLAAQGGPEKLKVYFDLCNVPDVKSPSDLGSLMNSLAEVFAEIVQYDKVENGRTKIAALCAEMTATHLGSPLQRLARVIANSDPGSACFDMSYKNVIKKYRDISWDSPAAASAMRQWYHQTCTEYGYYQTTSSDKSIFGTLFPLSYFTDMCIDLYGDYYNEKLLDSRVKRTNMMYGGQRPDLTNVIFTNGDIDPWHALSVLEDLNAYAPAILINGSSHCRDLYSDADTDVEDLKKARAKVRSIIGKWLSSVKEVLVRNKDDE